MEYDHDKADEVSLALLYLTLGEDSRAWKGMEWKISNRLYEKGWIENPRNKNASFVLTRAGREACIRFFQKHFEVRPDEKHEVTLSRLPVNVEMLVFLYFHPENKHRKPFLDAATGLIVWSDDEEVGTSNNSRYLSIPTCTPDETENDNNRKRARKHIKHWLESQPIFRL